jgi:hypothetical protein
MLVHYRRLPSGVQQNILAKRVLLMERHPDGKAGMELRRMVVALANTNKSPLGGSSSIGPGGDVVRRDIC